MLVETVVATSPDAEGEASGAFTCFAGARSRMP